MPFAVTIGKDERGRAITLGDGARRGGTYVLGKPRTGKSKLLIQMAVQDIAHGHGLLFIDPHADAINELLGWIPKRRWDDILLLDPTEAAYAFGINPLYCTNPKDLREQQLCFGQARDIFAKAFEKDETLGILLRKYLANCLYPLIETQGYSLYDLWDFLLNLPFRESVLRQVKYHREVVAFWHEAFDRMPPRTKLEETESLLTRIALLRTNPYIKHVISQPVPTLDFARVLQEHKIVLLRIPAWQDEESRNFVGTLVLSQLLKVVFLRTEISEHLRTPFALYIDELEYFSTPDVAKLFTQTGKWNLMPVVAHQTRLQFMPDDPNRGATLAAPIKVLFSQAVHDSAELAPEMAKDSPTETKRERILIISQHPVEDILKGHANPEVQAYVTEYLRSLAHRLEDTKEAMEGERIKRQQYQDAAALARLQAQFYKEDLSTSAPWRRDATLGALAAAGHMLLGAIAQNRKLLQLFESTQELRQVIRSLDRFLTLTMEGEIGKGQETFATFVFQLVSMFFPVTPALALYIALEYGEPRISRAIPFAVARRSGLYREEVARLTAQAEERTHRERREYLEARFAEVDNRIVSAQRDLRQQFQQQKADERAVIEQFILRHKGGFKNVPTLTSWPSLNALFETFVWLECAPALRGLVAPITSRFDAISAERFRDMQDALTGKYDSRRESYTYARYARKETIQQFLSFVQTCPGLHVMTLLFELGEKEWRSFTFRWRFGDRYHNLCVLDFPQIPGADSLALVRLLPKINAVKRVAQRRYYALRDRFFAVEPDQSLKASVLSLIGRKPEPPPKVESVKIFSPVRACTISDFMTAFEDRDILCFRGFPTGDVYRKVSTIRTELEAQWETFSKQYPKEAHVFKGCDELAQTYLVARAYDLFFFGKPVADATFPQPHMQGANATVAALMKAVEEIAVERPFRRLAKERFEWDRKMVRINGAATLARVYAPPETLSARVPSAAEREALKKACLAELSGNPVVTVVHDFVHFCDLLARPENHVKVPSTQYIETQVNTYTTQEMINQMAKELMELPPRTAYAKIVSMAPGSESVWKGKMQTLALADAAGRGGEVVSMALDNAIRRGILRKRSAIEADIRRRQERWRRGGPGSLPPPPTQTGGTTPPALPPGRNGQGRVPPPPTSTPPRGAASS